LKLPVCFYTTLGLPQENTESFRKKAIGENGRKQTALTAGNVANANWNSNDEEFRVSYRYPDNRNPDAGGRAEVSTQKESYRLLLCLCHKI
jgi:hypothetical protein